MNILIIGGLGKTAEPLITLLMKHDYNITILDLNKNNRYFNNRIKVIQGNICDFDCINGAFSDIDTIVHLAVNVDHNSDAELSFHTNVFGTYNIFMQAVKHNIKKVLIASSAPVHNIDRIGELKKSGYHIDYLCSPNDDFTYDLTKNIQELIAQNFSLTYDMNNMVLRLGHIVDGINGTELNCGALSNLMYCRGGWVCKYDVAKAFIKAIETDFRGFRLLNIIGSYQASEYFDLSTAKDIINFECDEKFLLYS